MSAWCDFGDLPADQCACPRCKPDVNEYAGVEIARTFVARYTSTIACGHLAAEGSFISVTVDDEFICSRCAA